MAGTHPSGGRPAEMPLPELRGELQIVGLNDTTGQCIVFDPVQQRYFNIGQQASQLLALWPYCKNIEDLAAAATAKFDNPASPDDVLRLREFLVSNALVLPGTESDWRAIVTRERHTHQSGLTWLIHNYLFLKIPLLRPQRGLEWLSPWVEPVYSRAFRYLVGGVGLLGLYLVSRQWDTFLATFPHLLTADGAILFGIALMIVKSLHELGHALTAVRYGCRIPSMGICFMLMVPMLYTDVSDAWRLQSRRERIMIDSAGIAVETVIACCATFAWVFLPEGLAKGLAFALATTSWFLCLGLNLNPFMRFDGYYILCDLTGTDNLQSRSFHFGVWKLRELLFDLRHAPPELITTRQSFWLVAYAWSVWLYRAILFTGIAVFVYQVAFKLLGLVLFVIEIIYFLAGPVWHEAKEWYRMRAVIVANRRGWMVLGLCLSAVALSFVPMSTAIRVPAIIEDRSVDVMHPRRPAQVVAIHARQGDRVGADQPIVALASPELEHEIQQARLRLRQVEKRLERRSGDPEELQQTPMLEHMRTSYQSQLAGLQIERSELFVVTKTEVVVAELDPHLSVGIWMKPSDRIGLLVGARDVVVRGYVNEADVGRIDLSQSAVFTPETLSDPSWEVSLTHIAPAGVDVLDLLELSSHFGGGVAARATQRQGTAREHIPIAGQFLISGRVDAYASGGRQVRVLRGTLLARGEPQSLAARTWRQVLKVLVRESGL